MHATKTAVNPFALAYRWSGIYRERGLQPLPSRMDAKRPLVKFSQWWESDAPADLFDQFATTNIQIMTGRYWGLLVIDLDGPEAVAQWPKIAPRCPRTWVSISGSGGQHWWFSVARTGKPLPKAELWRASAPNARVKGESAIERLCERSLIVAPPSLYAGKKHYRFRSKAESPLGMQLPALCPAWILDIEPIVQPKRAPIVSAPTFSVSLDERKGSAMLRFQWKDVLDSIDDKVALVKSWGVRIVKEDRYQSDWVSCRSIYAEDSRPSAGFNAITGRYKDHVTGQSHSLFDLGVRLGHFEDWKEAVDVLGARYCPGKQQGRSNRKPTPTHALVLSSSNTLKAQTP